MKSSSYAFRYDFAKQNRNGISLLTGTCLGSFAAVALATIRCLGLFALNGVSHFTFVKRFSLSWISSLLPEFRLRSNAPASSICSLSGLCPYRNPLCSQSAVLDYWRLTSFAFRHDFAKAKSARHQLAHRDVPRQLRCRRTCQNPQKKVTFQKSNLVFYVFC